MTVREVEKNVITQNSYLRFLAVGETNFNLIYAFLSFMHLCNVLLCEEGYPISCAIIYRPSDGISFFHYIVS